MAEMYSYADMGEILEGLDDAELDGLRSTLAAMLMEHTDLDEEEIYSLVFRRGRKIIWS